MTEQGGKFAADGPYWDGVRKGRLLIQQCDRCDRWLWPSGYRCSCCGSWDLTWKDVKPQGKIYSWIRTHHFFEGLEGLERPFVTVLVALDEADDRRLMGLLLGSEEGLDIGKPVTGEFMTRVVDGETKHTIGWRLA